MTRTYTDQELAAQAAQRDHPAGAQSAFRQLYERHAPALLSFLASRSGRSDAEDLAQAVWLRAWELLPTHYRDGHFRGWLFQMARNLAADHRKKHRPELDAGLDARPGLGDDATVGDVLERERAIVLHDCLSKLPPAEADLVRARLGGEKYEDLLASDPASRNAAYKRFHHAVRKLNDCVQRKLQ